jgi:hypothetical protein
MRKESQALVSVVATLVEEPTRAERAGAATHRGTYQVSVRSSIADASVFQSVTAVRIWLDRSSLNTEEGFSFPHHIIPPSNPIVSNRVQLNEIWIRNLLLHLQRHKRQGLEVLLMIRVEVVEPRCIRQTEIPCFKVVVVMLPSWFGDLMRRSATREYACLFTREHCCRHRDRFKVTATTEESFSFPHRHAASLAKPTPRGTANGGGSLATRQLPEENPSVAFWAGTLKQTPPLVVFVVGRTYLHH